jgi:STE24 endopeptidase
VQYLLLTFVLGFPLAAYEGFFREWKYGLATQTFGAWTWDQIKGLVIGLVLGGWVVVSLFWVVRKLPRSWWIWGAVVTMLFLVFTVMIGPVYLQPIFNKITRLDDPKVTQPILRMARANSIPANDVYEIDASKQTTRMSANVSGFGQTMRITLNDNLVRRGSLEEIEAADGSRDGTLCAESHSQGHALLLRGDCDRVRLPALVAGMVPQPLGHEVADSRD